MDNINARIKALRKKLKLTQTEFAEKLGVSRGVISNIDGDITTPSPHFLKLICDVYNVDRDWLETGEGEMFRETTREEELAAFIGDVLAEQTAESEFKATFLECLAKMTPEQWKALQDFCDSLANQNKKDED